MKHIRNIQLIDGSNEELLPGFSADFPYTAICAELSGWIDPAVPWHWHRSVELFYMESGTLEYTTPDGKWVFPAGSGGFVNSNILHTTRVVSGDNAAVQLLHQIDPDLISGGRVNRIEAKYIRPLITAPGAGLIALYPDQPEHAGLLQDIRSAFDISDADWGYELTLRHRLTDIWLRLFELARPSMQAAHKNRDADEKIKAMMLYIHEHYPEPIPVEQIAAAAHISRRGCFRLFRENLHMSPLEYMTGYRLQKAYQLLLESDESLTQIAYGCGLGSSSYFGKIFREHFGCTPAQCRKQWHDRDRK